MKFFFPDSQDFIDPSFDFLTEKRAGTRMRMRDDRYAHEVFELPPFDGLLVSKAIVDGGREGPGKYTMAQRHRLLRTGVREFFRLDDRPSTRRLRTIGDCGAFSYVKEDVPPYSVDDVLTFYDECGFDFGISVDHVIPDFDASIDDAFPGMAVVSAEIKRRQHITLELAAEFRRSHQAQRLKFEPLGVAQGWSPNSYASAVRELQKMGYRRIAIGGLVQVKTPDILRTLEVANRVRRPDTRFHLLGVTRTEHVETMSRYGVESFDTTSPFRRAFKDARANYYTFTRSYTALRVPQVQGNRPLEKLITAGRINQVEARRLERESLDAIRRYDTRDATVDDVLDVLDRYQRLYAGDQKDRLARYRETLIDRPWAQCRCAVCRTAGIEVIIFRGSERNKRRGFHNLHILNQRLHHQLSQAPSRSTGRSAPIAPQPNVL